MSHHIREGEVSASSSSKRARAVLTESQVLEIYLHKDDRESKELGNHYGVAPKTIRDIWKGR